MLGILPRYKGVDLPRFEVEPREVLRKPAQYREAANNPDVASFVRNTILAPHWLMFGSINRILDHTDRELDRAAETFGATVVPHEWGLVEGGTRKNLTPSALEINARRFLPPGTFLVARVDCLLPLDGYCQPEPHNSLAPYNKQPWCRLRGGLGDMDDGQFTFGINKNGDTSNPAWYLHDIEPRYGYGGPDLWI